MTNDVEQFQKIYLYKRVVQAKLFIDYHFAESIDLNNIADEAYFSKYHFIRLFKKIYGKTPRHYLIQVRVGKASQLLSQNIPVSQVCLSIGFNSPTSFAALFRKLTGTSPSEFQRQQQQRKGAIASSPLRFIPNCFAETHGWREK